MPLRIANKQDRRGNGGHPILAAQSGSYFLAVRFVERNQKGNYFRETQLSGRSVPVSSIGWFWSNDVPNAPLLSYRFVPDTHLRQPFPIHSEKPENAPRGIPSHTGIYRIIDVSKLIPKTDRIRKCGLFVRSLYRLVGLYEV